MKNSTYFWICAFMAALFVYGKYFVATTEIDKVYHGITAMLWVMMGLTVTYLMDIKDKLKEIEEKLK